MKRTKLLLKLLGVFLLIANTSFAQQTPSKEVRDKLQEIYNGIKKPEISFERFLELNAHIYSNQSNPANKAAFSAAAAALPQDTYCSKVRPYCTNSDFESGLDQSQYTGSYGLWSSGLYPNPFGLQAYGFISGVLTSSTSHQTIVTKGIDPIAGIPLVAANGGNQALRLGNAVNGDGTEIIAKTVTVDANENILGFYYAVVLQDPGHNHDDQPAFSVRAYDCATGQELPNVCDLGNGSNIAVADANNPFFQNKIYNSEKLVYRDWSKVQINLSKYVGKNVIIVFTTKDCNLSGHFGYAYIDNLFTNNCPATPLPGDSNTDPGDTRLDIVHTSICSTGNICAKYRLPLITSSGNTTKGTVTISLDIYQNNALLKTVTSPLISTYSSDSSYCFSIDPVNLGINSSIGGFDYTITGKFTLSGTSLSPVIVGNPGTGVKSGTNNDYTNSCDSNSNPMQPPTSPGTCPASIIISADPLTCMAKISWAEPSLAFPDSIGVISGVNLTSASLIYKGTYNGHGYYESTDQYKWPDARDAASAVGGHLITINSPAENTFVSTNIMEQFNYAWIGLYNTGTVGSFTWVTGEPLNFTNWIPGEPNNLYNDNTNPTVYDPYVHINGYDSLSRWNDLGDTVNAKFLAEFDNPLYTYRKYSGPSNGDMVKAGIYNICYERTNTVTGALDSCCFSITVTCTSVSSSGCPGDTTIIADPLTCKAKVTWTIPSAVYPDSVSITKGANLNNASLIYKGTFNGHGYYESNDQYNWPDARDAASAVGGHLITITSTAENDFIAANIMERFNYAWIGLYNTGTIGSFAWITGEPLGFTNWIPGEPNNLYTGNVINPTVFEPYVHINGYDSLSRWNDIGGDVNARFLAEFESGVITYRQISGPTYGDSLTAGTYTICYEKTNTITHAVDTCCFNIIVVCNNTTAAANSINLSSGQVGDAGHHIFNAIAYPNPSNTTFTLKINSDNSKDKVTMKVVDLTGRMIETKNNIIPGNTVSFGSKYIPGVYFTTITQGSKVIVMKMVKL